MTPQEEAKQLFDQYLYYVETISETQQTENAKKCALICVCEILSVIWDNPDLMFYYERVKQEIEKL
jgi:hypothetical protein